MDEKKSLTKIQENTAIAEQLPSQNYLTQLFDIVQTQLKSAMTEGVHYGSVPGVEKKFLWKPGAERLGMVIGVRPHYEITITKFEDNHREYDVKCYLYKWIDPREGEYIIIGEGEGSCSTLESKYKYRKAEGKISGEQVPREYWDLRKSKKDEDKKKLYRLKPDWASKPVKGSDNRWYWAEKTTERVENPDIPDLWNTVKKMACKRAYTAAIITATGASDIFAATDDGDEESPYRNTEEAQFKDMPGNGSSTVVETPQPSPGEDSQPSWFIETIQHIRSIDILYLFMEENELNISFFSEEEKYEIYKIATEQIASFMNKAKDIKSLNYIKALLTAGSNFEFVKNYKDNINNSYQNNVKRIKGDLQ